MRRNKLGILAALIGLGLASAAFIQTARANDLTVVGDAAGALTVVSADTALFDLNGLYPGDSAASTLTVRNDDRTNEGFSLSLYVENTVADGPDLAEVTTLRITGGQDVVYDGLLADANRLLAITAPVKLCDLASGESRTFDFTVTLDGERTDNRYQEQRAAFSVTLVANSYGPPAEPTPAPTTSPRRSTGGNTGRTITPLSVERDALEEAAPEEIYIDDPEVPLIDIDDSEVPLTDIDDPDMPLAEMPVTGEAGLTGPLLMGLAMAGCGLWILYRARRAR